MARPLRPHPGRDHRRQGRPPTFWASGILGPNFNAGPVSFYVAVGLGYYVNQDDSNVGLLPETGLSVRF